MIDSYENLVKIADQLDPQAIDTALGKVEERIDDILNTQKDLQATGDSSSISLLFHLKANSFT